MLTPERRQFAADPFGYSSLAWVGWAIAQEDAGIQIDPAKPPTSEDLKSPVLWLTQAHALTEAASLVIRTAPSFERIPIFCRGVCDSQYCAVGLMLIGYSLEVCLKAMLIIKKGVRPFVEEEKRFKHHRLVQLAEFVPGLSEKDKAILELLTHFVVWAGRYPDPGSGRENLAESVSEIAKKYQVSADDMLELVARIMSQTAQLTV